MATSVQSLQSSVKLTGLSPEQKRFTGQTCAVTLFGVGAAYAAAWYFGHRAPNLVQAYAGLSLLALVTVGGGALFSYTIMLLLRGESRPFALVTQKAAEFLTPAALASRVLPIFLVFAFLGAFGAFKSLIPMIHPFAWDAGISDLDRAIFGADPWRLTHALLGPTATKTIDFAYIMWLPVFTCVVFWHSVFAPFEQKRRFFLAFFGCWGLLGIIGAIIFSSAGPCFLTLIHHPYAGRYPFFPLQDGHGSQAVMNYLAEGYRTGDFGMAKGISAFPSMHVAVVTLYILAARRSWTVLLATIYFLIIFVGSVHLGWHYASDGLAGAVGTILIYSMTRESAERPLDGVAVGRLQSA
jgi:hypothetical protein